MAMNKQTMPLLTSGLSRQDMPSAAHLYGTCTNPLDDFNGLHMLGLGYVSAQAVNSQPSGQVLGGVESAQL